MNRMPQPGEIYQHFKGNLYRIVTMAEHTESGELLVVYQALYGNFQVYARPLSMFFDEVDHGKYPDVQAKQRFTLVPVAGNVVGSSIEPIRQIAGQTAEMPVCEAVAVGKMEEKQMEAEEEHFKEPEPAPLPEMKSQEAVQEEAFELDPRLLAFLEADSYEKKLEVYASLAGKVDESLLNTIAVSLDLELSGDTLEEQYDTLKNCLLMLERYECNRLR